MKIAFKKPKCAFTLDITGMMDGSDDFTRLQDPKVFKRVKVVHYGGGLQWGGDEMLEVGADTLFRMAEAQNRMTVKEAKKTMKELNLSQAEAARILDVDTRTFERMLEKGEPLKRPYTALMRAVRDDPNLLSAFHRPSRPAGRPKSA
ncbi:MAG: helix-turn-helix domain-containing protein [Rhodospirillales bacterium]